MKKIFALLLVFTLLIPATAEARSWYGDMDIKGKIILNDNDVDSAGTVNADTIIVTNLNLDTATVKKLLDMDSNAIINVDWDTSDTQFFEDGYLNTGEDTTTRINITGLLNAVGGADFGDSGIINISWDDSDTGNLDADLVDGIQGDSILRSDIEDTFVKLNGDTIDAVLSGSVDCPDNQYLRGDGTCSTDQQSVGASLVIQDDGITVESASDTLDFGRNLTANSPGADISEAHAYMKDYVSPDGLVIDTGGASDSVSLAVGGAVYVDFVGSSETTPQVIEIDAGDTVNLNESGCNGLLSNSTLRANQWFELGIAVDEDGTNPPCMVAYTHTADTDNTPTSAGELPTGYELFRAMGTPGKTWWVRTDGSSNIRGFIHESDGTYQWDESSLGSLGPLLDNSAPTTNSDQTVDASEYIPPAKANIHVNRLQLYANSNGNANGGISSETISNIANAQSFTTVNASSDAGPPVWANGVTSQTVHWRVNSYTSSIRIDDISYFKAVN